MPGEHSGDPYGYKQPVQPPKKSGHPTQRRRSNPKPYRPSDNVRRERTGTPGGNSYGRPGNGNPLGSNPSGTVAPVAPGINQFLTGDETYQSQLAAIAKALANYRSQMGERQDEYQENYVSGVRDLNKIEKQATTDQAEDFGGRGLLRSGLYGKARGELSQEYNQRESDMERARRNFLSGIGRDYTNYREEQSLAKQKARQDAIDRRAAKYMIV